MPTTHAFMKALAGVLLFGLLHCWAGMCSAAPSENVACQSRDLGFDQKGAAWVHVPLSKLKRDTVYSPVPNGDRLSVLRASADRSASIYATQLKPSMSMPMMLQWAWKTDALIPDADSRDKSREDAPLRVLVAFDGDHATLPPDERKRFKRAKSLSGRDLPYALLMYIWTDLVPVGSVIPSAHTSQVKMLVVASGRDGLGTWQSVQRNLADDYRRAYDSEPGPVTGIAVMTDTDNTGTKAIGEYADIRIACGKG